MSTQTLLVPTSTSVNRLLVGLPLAMAELKKLDNSNLDKPISGLNIVEPSAWIVRNSYPGWARRN
jgi:hypothetical protein